jgi:hypothetical protein
LTFNIIHINWAKIACVLDLYLTYSDTELLTFLSQSDQQAFECQCKRHWPHLNKSAFFILKDGEACKDIVQDVFIWLWEHRHNLQCKINRVGECQLWTVTPSLFISKDTGTLCCYL